MAVQERVLGELMKIEIFSGSLADLTVNQRVAGSSPAGGANQLRL